MSAPSQQPSPPTAVPTERPLWMLIGPGLGAVTAAFQIGLLFSLVTTLQREFGLSVVTIGAAVLVQLVATAAGLAAGFLLGRRAPIAVAVPGLVLMLIGAVVTMLSGAPAVLIAGGLLAGLGGGAVAGAAAALSGQVGGRKAQARLVLALAACGGLLIGLVLSWLVATTLSWRLAYVLLFPAVLLALIGTAAAGVAASMRNSR